ncbi:MAG: GNAT family N-acetyltransferase [Ktedonobacteraceae bacterium]|nr:GNAT family N-acetyltransferase [Ktedonobacteraceae bacterium]
MELATECMPYVRPRSESDYWMYGRLFSTTCRAMVVDSSVVGVIIAFRSQDDSNEVYVHDVMVATSARRLGYGRKLMEDVMHTAARWGVERIWLTSEIENVAAQKLWCSLGFINRPANTFVNGIWVSLNFKGPGRDRVVYERSLRDIVVNSKNARE